MPTTWPEKVLSQEKAGRSETAPPSGHRRRPIGGVDPPTRHLVLRRDLRDWNAIRDWAFTLPVPAPSKLAPAYEAVS
jgi:hypothetical protein